MNISRAFVVRALALVASAIAGGLALSYEIIWPLVFLALVPAYALVYDRTHSSRAAFWWGWLFGFALIGTVIHWTFNAYPLDWTGLDSRIASGIVTAAVWFTMSASLGFFAGLWVLAARAIAGLGWIDMVTVPISWILFEALRMWGFTIVTWGAGSVFEAYFSFGMLGYALAANDYLLSLAQFGGVFALSAIVALVSYVIGSALSFYGDFSLRSKAASALFVLILCLVPIAYPLQLSQSPLSIEVLATDFPSTLTASHADRVQKASELEIMLRDLHDRAPEADIVVLPEGAQFTRTLEEGNRDPQAVLQSIFGDREILLIDSQYVDTASGSYEEVVFFSSRAGELEVRKKRLLIAFGEYVPAFLYWGMKFTGLGEEAARAAQYRTYMPGEEPSGFIYKGVPLVALVCSEILSPTLYRDVARAYEHPVLINMSSQAVFRGAKNPYAQLIAMAKVHAAWTGAPYYQATNGGASFTYIQ